MRTASVKGGIRRRCPDGDGASIMGGMSCALATALDDYRNRWSRWILGPVYERTQTAVIHTDSTPDEITLYTRNDLYQYIKVGGQDRSYDLNGQLTDPGGWTYGWTAWGRLASASPDTGTAIAYEYDALGRRVRRTEGAAVEEYLYLGWHLIGVWDATSSSWKSQEIPRDRGEGMLEHLARDDQDLDGDQDTSEYRPYAVHEDFQHTVRALSDAGGAVVERYRYPDPYGGTETEDGSGNPLGPFASRVHHLKRLHGGVTDAATGLYDFRNRWLEPETGAWTARDPLGDVDSLNPYGFLLCSPLDGTDAFGLCRRKVLRTAYGLLVRTWCEYPGSSKDYPGRCQGKAGCTSAGCRFNKRLRKARCVVHVRGDCEHPDALRLGCWVVREHEEAHARHFVGCLERCATEMLQDLEKGRRTLEEAAEDIESACVEWCSETDPTHTNGSSR